MKPSRHLAAHGTESRYRWEVENGGSCEVCRKAHGARGARDKAARALSDDLAYPGGWKRRGVILVPDAPRPVDRTDGGRIQPKPIEHGTDRGFQQHRYRREEACDACRVAHNADMAKRRAA